MSLFFLTENEIRRERGTIWTLFYRSGTPMRHLAPSAENTR